MFDKSSNSYSIERQTLVQGQYLFGICLFLPTKKTFDILQLNSGYAILTIISILAFLFLYLYLFLEVIV